MTNLEVATEEPGAFENFALLSKYVGFCCGSYVLFDATLQAMGGHLDQAKYEAKAAAITLVTAEVAAIVAKSLEPVFQTYRQRS